MVFKRSDIYTSSGTVMLQNSWTPYVSKYDTSSFYNWEQDNLPLYDLEERTYELWEKAGYPTSAVPGLSLTVSAHATAAVLAANSTVFTSLSSCLAAIPNVIRFPVLVEVCDLGNLGKLELHNIRMEEAGSLEIINRGYSKVYNASGTITTVASPAASRNASNALVTAITAPDVSATLFSSINIDACTSGLALETRVLSGAGDVRVSSVNSFLYPKLTTTQAPLSVALNRSDFLTGVVNKFAVTPYESVVTLSQDSTLGNTDVSAINQATGNPIKTDSITAGAAKIGGSVYLNTLTGLSVKNSNGPIYIRNFCVNGNSITDGGTDVGFDIDNSNVVLENCAAARCREAGFKFNNSQVVLSRSAFSYRNYSLSSADVRDPGTGIGFHAINSDVSVSALIAGTAGQQALNPFAADFQAEGDDVIVAASRNTIGMKLENSKLHGGFGREIITQEHTGGITTFEVNSNDGIALRQSEIELDGLLDVYGNNVGITSRGSEVTYNNLCVSYHTNQGVESKNSTFLFDSEDSPRNSGQSSRHQVEFHANGQHIDLQDESAFVFARKDSIPIVYGNMQFSGCYGTIKYTAGTNGANLPALSVDNNSVLNLVHPDIRSREANDTVESVPTYGMAVRATNNSVVSLFGTGSGCNLVWGPTGYSTQKYSAGLYGDKASEINLHGPTVIAQFGVDVLVENNSTLNIQPPRIRDSYGLEASGFILSQGEQHTSVELHSTRACLVANKNSNINLTDLGAYSPNWGRNNNAIGLAQVAAGADYPIGFGGFDNSSLVVSGSLQFFPNPQDSNAITTNHLDDITNASYANVSLPTFPIFTPANGMNQFLVTGGFGTPNYAKRAKLTQGGTCVRATQDSNVNVLNVHFPFGTNNTPLDGHYYTTSGSDCDKLMIWNIADTSRLNAAFCAVSGMWPGNAQYHGPSAIYVSSFNGTAAGLGNEAVAFGAPAGTPDTGSLSVLDAYGAGSSVWTVPSGVTINSPFDRFYAVSAGGGGGPEGMFGTGFNTETASAIAEAGINVSGNAVYQYGADPGISANQGIFRIYWTPKTAARFLQTDLSGYYHGSFPHGGNFSGVVGPAYQLFSQCYNLSSPVSGLVPDGETNTSALALDLLKMSYDTNGDGVPNALWTSGFYYCSEMLEENPTQCILDESASLTFANSKNASLRQSGRPKKVTLYRSRSDSAANRGSEAYTGDASGALGFKSAAIFDLKRDN